jgi:hypothetical protein
MPTPVTKTFASYGAWPGGAANPGWTVDSTSGATEFVLIGFTFEAFGSGSVTLNADTMMFSVTEEAIAGQDQANPAPIDFSATLEPPALEPQANVTDLAYAVTLKSPTFDTAKGVKRGNRILPGRYDFGSRSK